MELIWMICKLVIKTTVIYWKLLMIYTTSKTVLERMNITPMRVAKFGTTMILLPQNYGKTRRTCAQYLRFWFYILYTHGKYSLAYSKNEAKLKEISDTIKYSTPYLSDISTALTRDKIFMVNNFNLEGFSDIMWEGICVLFICAPVILEQCLTKEL